MSLAAAFPADASSPAESPSTGRYEYPTSDPQPPVGTMPTGPRAEAEAAALQSAHTVAPDEARYVPSGLVMFGSILAAEQVDVAPEVAPISADGECTDWPEAPFYSTTSTSTGRVLAGIDTLIGDSLGQRNQTLRAQLRDATGELARERSLRQDAQARLAQAEIDLAAAHERIAELDLTVRTLGEVIAHAAGHDKGGE